MALGLRYGTSQASTVLGVVAVVTGDVLLAVDAKYHSSHASVLVHRADVGFG